MTKATDPLGRVLLRARYDKAGRAVEAGDAAGAYSFEYDAAGNGLSRRTTVTDPLGAGTVFTHTKSGALAGMAEDEGLSAHVEYNSANRPVRVSDTLGSNTEFTYDAEHRLLRYLSSDGSEKSFTYDGKGQISSTAEGNRSVHFTRDARGNIIAARSSDDARSYEATYNARGQATSLTSKRGRTLTFEYDAVGNETAFTYSDTGRFETEYDTAGRKVAARLPSGLTFRYEYDAGGKVSRESDSQGRSLTVERDTSGALTGLVAGDGQWIRATRDHAGRIVALTRSSGKSRHFAYDARGALTDYTDARGRNRKLKYDRRGRLQTINGSEGARLRYSYDRTGQLVGVKREVGPQTAGVSFMPASYGPLFQDFFDGGFYDGCMFGGDGWYDGWYGGWFDGWLYGWLGGDAFYQIETGCNDPFLGFSGGGQPPSPDSKVECAKAVAECLLSVVGYVQGIGLLITACAPSLGATCLIALIAHPILGAAVALLCSNAIKVCRVA